MAMDERQRQIREGAGLEESRLNVEFIDFLKKWSSPALVVVALLALGYFGLQKLKEHRHQSLEAAFAELESAMDSASPTALLAVAENHAGQAAVAEMARLYAADVYLNSARAGLAPGATVDANGKPRDPADLLTPEQIEQQLARAAELYQAVVDRTSSMPDQVQHTIGGLYGLAAVAESRQKPDEARSYYQRIVSIAQEAGLPEDVARAQGRIDTLSQLTSLPRLYNSTDLAAGKLTPVSGPPGTSPFDIAPVGPIDVNAQPAGPAPATDAKTPDAPATPPAPAPTPAGDKPPVPAPAAPPAAEKPGEPAPSPPPTPPPGR
jgi:hypothetical protein